MGACAPLSYQGRSKFNAVHRDRAESGERREKRTVAWIMVDQRYQLIYRSIDNGEGYDSRNLVMATIKGAIVLKKGVCDCWKQ